MLNIRDIKCANRAAIGIISIAINLLSDIVYRFIDPRTR